MILEKAVHNWQTHIAVQETNLTEVALYFLGRLKAKLTKQRI